jgi:hypothetical protein
MRRGINVKDGGWRTIIIGGMKSSICPLQQMMIQVRSVAEALASLSSSILRHRTNEEEGRKRS